MHTPRPTPSLCILATLILCLASCSSKQEMNSKMSPEGSAAPMAEEEQMDEAPMESAKEAPEPGRTMKKSAESDKEKGGKKGSTWKRSTKVAHTSKLSIGDKEELPIRGMQVFTKVDGFRARVLVDFYFLNDREQQLEGTFKVRLPQGATPYFLAFGQSKFEADVPLKKQYDSPKEARTRGFEADEIMLARQADWIDPKEARMVPKKKAARAYGRTVRRRVDPALMEWSGAGVFSAKVFPLTPRKVHRVVLGYDMNLERLGDDLELLLPMPDKIPALSVNLDVAQVKGSKIAIKGLKEKGFLAAGRRSFQLFNPKEEVRVRIDDVPSHLLRGSDPDIGGFFTTRFTPTLPKQKAQGCSDQALFLLDTSLSSNPDKFGVWLKLMKTILEKNRDQIRTFNVMHFNIETKWWKRSFVANTPENVAALNTYVNGLALEGATDLGAALQAAKDLRGITGAKDKPTDLFLLSDGAVTWGESDPFAIAKKANHFGSLFAYRTGMSGSSDATLQSLTRQMGGAIFSVIGESELEVAAKAHRSRPWRINEVTMTGASDLLIAGRPTTIFPGQRLVVAGRGTPKKGAKMVLKLAQGTTTTTLETPIKEAIDSPLASRAYGQLAVGQIEEFLGTTREFAEAYARHFRITGKSTSLLMLDTEADYKEFGIVPKDDAKVIRDRTATQVVLGALDTLALKLGDARAAFLAMLEELKEVDGVKLSLPPELVTTLKALPSSNYLVQTKPLATTQTSKEKLDDALLKALKTRTISYDQIAQEAARRRQSVSTPDALKAWSSMVELKPGDGVLMRDIGFSAMEMGLHDQAYYLLRRVAKSRPYEPQTWHALALTLAKSNYLELAMSHFEIGLAGAWDSRFGEFQRILQQDYIRFLRQNKAELHPSLQAFATTRLQELERKLEVKTADLVITIMWNTDNTDIDLHVIEPSGEECYYSHPKTKSGGRLTRDVTQGYGPEMYVLPKAPKGNYNIRAKYFSSNRSRLSTRTKVYATITRNWGRENETVVQKVISLEDNKQMHDLELVKVGSQK